MLEVLELGWLTPWALKLDEDDNRPSYKQVVRKRSASLAGHLARVPATSDSPADHRRLNIFFICGTETHGGLQLRAGSLSPTRGLCT
jgi:hypothetical protein